MMAEDTPLAHCAEIAKLRGCPMISILAYELKKGDDYRTTPQPQMIPVREYQSYYDKFLENTLPNMEVGICSRVVTGNGHIAHFMFGDMLNGQLPPNGRHDYDLIFTVQSSANGWHFYTDAIRTDVDFPKMMGELLCVRGIDHRWAAAGLLQGFNVLRLTARHPRFEGFVPRFVTLSKDDRERLTKKDDRERLTKKDARAAMDLKW